MSVYSLDILLFQFGTSPVTCPVITVASWPGYRFLRRQVKWSGIPISRRIFHSFFVIHTVKGFISGGSKTTVDGDCSHGIKRCLLLGRKTVTNLDSILKIRDITLPSKIHLVKAMDHKEGWAWKNWCFWTVVLEKTLEGPLDSKEIKLVNPKGNQSWIFIGRTDAEAEALVLLPPDVKNGLIGKDRDPGKDRRLEVKRTTEDEMVGWHHRLDAHEFEQAPRVHGIAELDPTE